MSAFLADLVTYRDRAIVLLMVFGGLRAAEVRSLRLADVDQGRRQVRVVGKGGRERTVPVDRTFFAELAAYLRVERPPGLTHPRVLRGAARADDGASHDRGGDAQRVPLSPGHFRGDKGATPPVAPHLWHRAWRPPGIDLLVLRDLMGHASPETTADYVHLSNEHVAAEYAAARAVMGR